MVRMRCPKLLEIAWKNSPPYFYINEYGNISGVFSRFVKDMIWDCCNNRTTLSFLPAKQNVAEMSEVIRSETADLVFPLIGKKTSKLMFGNPYFSLVESPGMVYFSATKPSASQALYTSISDSWPVLLFILLYSMVVGAFFWIFELLWEESRQQLKNNTFKNNSVGRIFEGFWWAVVSITTVGYGDFCPRTVAGRITAVLWILNGLVILSTFTAAVTSALTTAVLSNEFSLAGLKVAVLIEGGEAAYAVKQNAKVKEVPSIEDITSALQGTDIAGSLLETYTAGHYSQQLKNFPLSQIVESPITYGYVASRRGKWVKQCFARYMQSNRNVIFKTIMSEVKAIKPSSSSLDPAKQKSSSLFDPESYEMKMMLIFLVVLLLVFVVAGFIVEKFRNKKIASGKGERQAIHPADQLTEEQLLRRHQKESKALLQGLKQNIEMMEESLTRKLESIA